MLVGVEALAEQFELLIEHVKGEQWRCPECGTWGPKVPQLTLREITEIMQRALATVRRDVEKPGGPPVTINVYGAVPRPDLEEPEVVDAEVVEE